MCAVRFASWMLSTLAILNAADGYLTDFAVGIGAVELSPVARRLIEAGLLSEVKLAVSCVLVATAIWLARRKCTLPNWIGKILVAVVLLYSGIVANNILQILILLRFGGFAS